MLKRLLLTLSLTLALCASSDAWFRRGITPGAPPPDTTPDAYSFTNVSNGALSTQYTSNSILVNGINGPASISITGAGCTYDKNASGSFTASPGTVLISDTVRLRLTSSSSYSTTLSCSLDIGGVGGSWSVATQANPVDTTPDAFSFVDVPNAALLTQYTSAPVAITGINSAAAISITGTGCTYDKNSSGTFTSSAGTVVNNDTVRARTTSSASYATSVNCVVTVGGVSDTFSVSTLNDPSGYDAFSELPRALPPYTLQVTFANNYTVASGDATDLQNKINTARSTAGFNAVTVPAVFYNLNAGLNIPPSSNGNTGILIRTANYASLPAQSTPGSTWGAEYRVSSNANMATFSLSVVSNLITIPLNSHNIQFQGIEFANTVFNVAIVMAGDTADTNTNSSIIPNNLIFRHCYFHGLTWPNGKGNATARGLRIDAANAAVLDSRFDRIYGELGIESQAILAISATGPFLIHNNFIQGATENIMFGGGDPRFTSQAPLADITITRNHFSKDINWFNGTSGSTVKNLLEFKFGSRALIEGNVFENLGVQQQGGSGIVINNVSQNGTSLWTTVRDYVFRYNVVRNVGQFMEISANYNAFSQTSSVVTAARISVHDNLVYNQGQYLPFTGTLPNNPFTTTNGSSDVLVHWVGHPFYNNQQGRIIITGASAVGGLTLNGTWWVRKADFSNAIVDADNFYITAGGNATSSATGGGASATYTAGEATSRTFIFTAVSAFRHNNAPFPEYFDGLSIKQNIIVSNMGAGNNVLYVADSDANNTRWDWQNNILSWGAYGLVDQGLVNFNMLDTYWPGSYTNSGNVYVESDGTSMPGNTVVTGAISTVIPGYATRVMDPGSGYAGKGPDMPILRDMTFGVVTAGTNSIN